MVCWFVNNCHYEFTSDKFEVHKAKDILLGTAVFKISITISICVSCSYCVSWVAEVPFSYTVIIFKSTTSHIWVISCCKSTNCTSFTCTRFWIATIPPSFILRNINCTIILVNSKPCYIICCIRTSACNICSTCNINFPAG
jgi:hypothetical protein